MQSSTGLTIRSKQDSSSENDVTVAVKRRKIKKTSAYNLFCPDFNKSGNRYNYSVVK